MNDLAIATIARQYLGIETLDVRNSDSWDFYDLSVSSIRKALEAAYQAGHDDSRSKVDTSQFSHIMLR